MSEHLHACVYRYVAQSFIFSRELGEALQNRFGWDIEKVICPDTEELEEDLREIETDCPDLAEEIGQFRKWVSELKNLSYDSCVFETY